MPSNMDYDALFQQPPQDEDVYQKIERCEKTIRTIRKAVLMRLLLTCLLIYIPFAAKMSSGVVILMIFVILINAGGILPLTVEWKKQKAQLDKLLDDA